MHDIYMNVSIWWGHLRTWLKTTKEQLFLFWKQNQNCQLCTSCPKRTNVTKSLIFGYQLTTYLEIVWFRSQQSMSLSQPLIVHWWDAAWRIDAWRPGFYFYWFLVLNENKGTLQINSARVDSRDDADHYNFNLFTSKVNCHLLHISSHHALLITSFHTLTTTSFSSPLPWVTLWVLVNNSKKEKK